MIVAKLNHNRITVCGNLRKTEFFGSASYGVFGNEIYRIADRKGQTVVGDTENGYLTTLAELDASVKAIKLTALEREDLRRLKDLSAEYVAPEKKQMQYKINKKMIFDKALAFSQLKQSAKFMAFYSVSFPAGMSVDNIYKAWNKFLTNCRKYYGLNNYLWVAEYQKNGTLHYHLLTNDFMQIRKVNASMATVLYNQGELTEDKRLKYNGVDVRRVNGNKQKVISYITKYVSKQEENVYTRRPWFCTRSISALMTAKNLTNDELDAVRAQMEDDNICPYMIENEYVQIFFINQPLGENKGFYNLPARFYARLKHINQLIYDDVTKNK